MSECLLSAFIYSCWLKNLAWRLFAFYFELAFPNRIQKHRIFKSSIQACIIFWLLYSLSVCNFWLVFFFVGFVLVTFGF